MGLWRSTTLLVGLALLSVGGCASFDGGLSDPPRGRLQGTLLLQWDSEDGFIYVPDPSDPLIYAIAGKPTLQPGRMYTDGGSIPRVFWSAKGFSPWAYGPAYILHDWLFNEHRCKRLSDGPAGYTLLEANAVLYDAIGILVAQGKADSNGEARRLIKWAVDTFGQSAWDGACIKPPPPRLQTLRAARTITLYKVSFGR